MRSLTSTLILVTLLAAAAALPAAAAADSAPSRALVCMTAPTGPLAAPAAQPPLSLGTARSTPAVPATTVPPVVLLTPQPQTGAYVVPTLTTMPSVPGVTVPAPQVVIPPLSTPGQNRAGVATALLQGVVGPSAAATPICY